MNNKELASTCGVSQTRVSTISRALFGSALNDFTDEQAIRVAEVVDFMTAQGVRSVKNAIAQMNEAPTQSTESAPGNGGDLFGQLAQVVDASSSELADQMTAAVLAQTLQKFGNTNGRRAAEVLENFTQALIPTDQGLVNAGLVLPGFSPQQERLLTASTAE